MKISVAFLVWKFPVLSETFILNQITGLIDRDVNVDIYPLGGRNEINKMHSDIEAYHLLDHIHDAPKIPINHFKRKWLSFKFLLTERGLYEYDIIHCQFGTMGLRCLPLLQKGILKGKLITSFRGYDISQVIKQRGKNIYIPLFRKGNLFTTNCEYFKQRLINLGCSEEKLIVHRSGIKCEEFNFKLRRPHVNGKIRIATIGRLVEKKGIEYLIRAVALLTKINQKIECDIIGDGPLKENLQKIIYELGIQHSVTLLGRKNQQEIIEVLDSKDIFIAPSITANDGDQDAPVNTLKEAMAMGLPVIGTRHGGIPELIKDGISGYLVPERDSAAIAEKIIYLIEHREAWPKMCQAARCLVEEQYDNNMLNDKLVDLYQKLLTQN